MEKGYDHQMRAEATPRNSNQTSQQTPSKLFFKDVWEQLQMAVSAAKIYWKTFLCKIISSNWNLILRSLKSFSVLPLFETIVEYICNCFTY